MVIRLLPLLAALLVGCTPVLDDSVSLVSGPRLLGIAATPAEAAPPATVTFRALYVDPGPDATLSWAYCVAREALTDQGTVSPACLAAAGSALVPIGTGTSAPGALPMDGCQLFGPDLPPTVNGQPSGRPADPDETGGYYQPVRLLVDDDDSESIKTSAVRLACGVGDTSQAVSSQFAEAYRLNENPALASLTLNGAVVAPDAPGAAPGASVAAGATVTLAASWVACPTTPVCGDGICGIDETVTSCPEDCTHPMGCTGSEQYVWVDPSTQSVATRREAIRVDWFFSCVSNNAGVCSTSPPTDGTLADDSTGVAEADAATHEVGNTWTAPTTAGEVRLWVVIRDDRGGSGWQAYRVMVGG